MILNNTNRNWLIILTLIVPVLAGSCYYDKAELLYPDNRQPGACDTVPASFNTDVFPLITSRCAIPDCHNVSAQGGLIFQNYDQISAAKDKINIQAVIQKTMPETGPLSNPEINILRCWIEGGALNN